MKRVLNNRDKKRKKTGFFRYDPEKNPNLKEDSTSFKRSLENLMKIL